MALPVLDGNQSATTLSSVVTGGEHIVAHTVVSLGSTAISNITSAVSGSVVSISNFPSTQTIAGTVTANAIGYNYQEAAFTQIPIRFDGSDTNFVAIGPSVDPIPIPISGTVAVSNTVTIGSLPAISGTVTVGSCVTHAVTLASTTVTVSSLPTISGTVTASLSAFKNQQTGSFFLNSFGTSSNIDCLGYSWMFLTADGLNSGTWERIVQWSNDNTNWNETNGSPVYYWGGSNWEISNSLQIQLDTNNSPKSGNTMYAIPVIGRYFRITSSSQGQQDSVTYRYLLTNSAYVPYVAGSIAVNSCVTHGVTIANSVTIGSLPRVTFIDGSGTVVTANSAVTLFASSSTRSYLLVQVTTGSAFVNVGATATTLNGISLTAGQGYAWETTIPQGAVSLISTTTSSRYVAKEA